MADYSQGRLSARPATTPQAERADVAVGLQPLGTGARRDGLVYIPSSYEHGKPAPLCIMMHGAGGNAKGAFFPPLRDTAEQAGMIIVSPQSQASSWDVIRDGYGPDVQTMDQALHALFAKYTIDASRCSIGGFSDGASYALSLGVTNGDLFNKIIAFSPGFMRPGKPVGQPEIYISHGTDDAVLSIDHCSRRLVPRLQKQGFQVMYNEFEGPHVVRPHVCREALDWFLGN